LGKTPTPKAVGFRIVCKRKEQAKGAFRSDYRRPQENPHCFAFRSRVTMRTVATLKVFSQTQLIQRHSTFDLYRAAGTVIASTPGWILCTPGKFASDGSPTIRAASLNLVSRLLLVSADTSQILINKRHYYSGHPGIATNRCGLTKV